MSYILEALRKVEQQREHLPVHGLSSRRRQNKTTYVTSWPRSLFIAVAAAAAAGALLSGGLSVYLTADSNTVQPGLQSTVDTARGASGAAQAAFIPNAYANEQQRISNNMAEQTPPLQTARVSPLQLPVHRQQAQTKVIISQNDQEEKEKPPQSNEETRPPQENKPETKQPTPTPRDQRTEVAVASDTSRQSTMKKALHPAISPKRIVHNKVPDMGEVIDRIRPPLEVTEQPFRPNEVLRPSPAKINTTPGEPPMLSMLSSQFQSAVPKLSIGGYVYSPVPEQRVVVINMKLYNEGQSTPEGVIVEAVRQDDIICSYQGQRFRLGRD